MQEKESVVPEDVQAPLEELTSDGQASGLEIERGHNPEGAIKAPFDPSKIDVITQARTVDLLLTRLREGELDLSPDFQRRANIWDDDRKSSLIESMLLRIPIPSFYISEDKDGNYTVVDGLQRLCAIAHFVDVAALNKAVSLKLSPLRLTNLQSFEYKDRTYSDLPRPLQRRISETELTLHIIRASTPGDVKFNIFSRINQGGLPLTAQEIRNAIYGGEWRRRIRDMAESHAFHRATSNKIKGERMEDMELVLRFVAHHTSDQKRPDDQNMDEFLNDFVQTRCVHWSNQKWNEVEHDYYWALAAAPQVFGRHAFRKYFGQNQNLRPINRGLFETEMVLLAKRSEQKVAILADRQPEVLAKLAQLLLQNDDFSRALLYATGRGSSSNIRLSLLDRALNEVVNA